MMLYTTNLLLLLVGVITSAALSSPLACASCVPKEREALLAFKQGITSDPNNLLASWEPTGELDCCKWEGVQCSNWTGHVLELHLGDGGLVGEISHSLLSLHHLEYLNVSNNSLQGPTGKIPEFIGSFKSLRYLDLSLISFSGMVPPQLGNISKLHYLDLTMDYSNHYLYSTDLSWLKNLPLMEYLGMTSVDLSRVADWPYVMNMLPSLRILTLVDCSLTSADQLLPHLNFTKLEKLHLGLNKFNHPVASCWFWNVISLEYLSLYSTDLYGEPPDRLGDMVSLQELDLSSMGNRLALTKVNMRKMCNLTILDLFASLSYGNITELIEMLPQCSTNKLQKLDLASNNLTGSLPNYLGHLTSLNYFVLSGINIIGSLPASIGNFTNLTNLELDGNLLSGHIPSEIGNLAALTTLDLSSNYLSGHIPSEIGKLAALTILDLGGNHLSGHLPSEIGKLAALTILDLGGNHLSGHLPSEIGKLTALTTLDLRTNDFYGWITEEHFDGLQSLEYIDLSYNQLRIMVDSKWLPPFRLQGAYFASTQFGPLFPVWLKEQVNIFELDISNSSINDRLPDWFSNTFSDVRVMQLNNNQIYGKLPKYMDSMSLELLYIGSNNLTGQIPTLPKTLNTLDISANSLSGPLPFNFGAPQLSLISLYSNHFSGQVPASICELNLYGLDLSNNLLEGEIPGCINNTGVEYLLLSNNNFHGNFPSSLRSCTSLKFLDLSWNRLFGTLPRWIGSFSLLQLLRLDHNMFYGNIPDNITSLYHLYHLNLAANRISGVIPPYLSNLTLMTRMYIFLTATIPAGFPNIVGELIVTSKRQELKYHGDAVLELLSIDLSSNYLTGEIPEEITSLYRLLNLNLSRNELTGVIPAKIGAMQYLESLDLSNNRLTGEIPSSISRLTYLSALDLSNNNLTGTIPSGGQLDTLYTQNPSMYDGNTGLCGRPLPRICGPLNNNTSDHGYDKQRHEKTLSAQMFFYLGLSTGYVAGLWVVFCVLLFHKAWRIAYFALFDKYYDKVYVFVVVTWKSFTKKEPKIN